MRGAARLAGLAVVAAALVFLGRELAAQWPALGAWRPSRGALATLAGLALVYAAALLLLAEGWHRIVGHYGPEPRARTVFAFTVSQVARYLPGNVAHLLGRALYLRGGPVGDGDLARATLAEIATTPAGALVVLAALAPLVDAAALGPWPGAARAGLMAAPVLALAAWLVVGRLFPRLPGPGALALPVALAAAFMGVLAGVFVAVMGLVAAPVGPAGAPPLATAATLAAAALVAWVAGYATPGAPGGLGAREAVLVLLLGPVSAPADLLLATVLLRVVTTLGELVCFAAGWPLRWVFTRAGQGDEQGDGRPPR